MHVVLNMIASGCFIHLTHFLTVLYVIADMHFCLKSIIIWDLKIYTKVKSLDISTKMLTEGLSLLDSGNLLSSSNTESV